MWFVPTALCHWQSKYAQLQERGEWRLSHKATVAALLISLYKEQPVFHVPARLLSLLVDIDEFLTAWRYRHALMVHRFVGWWLALCCGVAGWSVIFAHADL